MRYIIKPSQLNGQVTIPPSKSHTLRAILFASLANGKSIIRNYLHSPDTQAMIQACQLLGADITQDIQHLIVQGVGGKPKTPGNIIDAGNSGQVFRFIAAVAALTSGYTVITGDHSIRHNRPITPLLDAFKKLGVFAVSTQVNGYAPIIVKGPLKGGITSLSGEDSQPVSALLIAAAFADRPTIINVFNPGETPWIDLTLDWFKRLGISYQQQGYTQYMVAGNSSYAGFEYTVPGDFSSCAFPLVGALITQSAITLGNLDIQDVQGDKVLITTLQQMGALLEIDNNKKTIAIKNSKRLQARTLNVNSMIDAVPILATLACFLQGKTIINGAAIARNKESDRLTAITQELSKMGAKIQNFEDGLIIQPANLTGTVVNSQNDHRIAMSLTIAALAASGETIVENVQCVGKSYPDFAESLQRLGAAVDVQP